jgi:uncharacterized membrane protein
MNSQIGIKIGLAIFLFLCLLDMPYGFYQLVRFIALISFGILANQAYLQKKRTEMIIYVALALLFQPFLKVSLGRGLWNIVDILVGIGLIVSILIKNQKQNDKTT